MPGEDAAEVHLLDLAQHQAQQGNDEALSQIAKHDAEQQDVGEGQEGGGVHLAVAGNAVHIHKHLKGLDQKVVLQLGRCLKPLVTVVIGNLHREIGVQLQQLFLQTVRLYSGDEAHQNEAVLVDAGVAAQFKRIAEILYRGIDGC